MKRFLYGGALAAALGLTYSGTAALIAQVGAVDGLKSSLITFVLNLGLALLGPVLLVCAIYFHRRTKRAGEGA